MIQQSDLLAAHIVRLTNVANHEDDPVDGTTVPDYTMSPVTSTALPTTGFLIILKAPASGGGAIPDGEDETFTVTIWVRNPVTNVWGAGEPTAIGYNQVFVTGDIDAAELYFQIGDIGGEGGGEIQIHIAEI